MAVVASGGSGGGSSGGSGGGKFLPVGPSAALSFAYTHSDRATGRAQLHPGWLDRAFRELSNGGSFDGFGYVVAPRGGVQFSKKVFFTIG